ncbi:hypothetical protein [Hafnia sp. HMSC23F03]|uniref:hypothetical protein n=1 Tax=Hafnia sp. HMSC23F03 TaxID=1581059 RepID=UPI0008A5146B|nr:hypothetical protein [Hafnia sp. HMSC23F03]OFS10998.1 hypothetical protein HMPREF3091_07760 [Hafnia sp. HMSC23F03]
MKWILKLGLLFITVGSANTFAASDSHWDGVYLLNQTGKVTINSPEESISYSINIDSKKNQAFLDVATSSSIRPAIISCSGLYDIKDSKGILELTFSSQNKAAQCSFPAPQFKIKKTGNTYSIKSDSFSNSPSAQWLQLTKTRDVVCDPTIYHEMESTDICYYNEKNILQTYKKYLSSFKDDSVRNDFIPKIQIGKNQQVKNQGNTMYVNYTWKGDRHLSVLQQYGGGETETLFDYDGTNTKVTINSSAD